MMDLDASSDGRTPSVGGDLQFHDSRVVKHDDGQLVELEERRLAHVFADEARVLVGASGATFEPHFSDPRVVRRDDYLAVPIVSRQSGRHFGAFVLSRADGPAFCSTDEQLAAMLAGQAALAFENVRLASSALRSERALSRQARQALLSADVSAAVARADGLRPMLERCAQAVVTNLDAAFARIWTLNEAGDTLELQASAGMYSHIDGAHARVPLGSLKIGRIAAEAAPHLTNDVCIDPMIGDRAWAISEGLKAFAGYPLRLGGRVVGVLALFSRATLADDTLELLASVADTIAIGIARSRSEQALRDLADRLERRVHERTAELLDVNKDLETLSQTVSHDLRAPIRHVAGFVSLLREHTAGTLDPKADHYVETIGDAAQHMSALVDGLLELSRVGRAVLAKRAIDTDALVRELMAELTPELQGRRHSFTVAGELPRLFGDPVMLRSVFANLLSNAFKYSSLAAESVIEVGSETSAEGHAVIFVRDNGVGFNMSHADRLFVLPRLGGHESFEGAGIGLAIVKRVIQRHGGQVWAAGAEGLGATFFFSLPAEPASP